MTRCFAVMMLLGWAALGWAQAPTTLPNTAVSVPAAVAPTPTLQPTQAILPTQATPPKTSPTTPAAPPKASAWTPPPVETPTAPPDALLGKPAFGVGAGLAFGGTGVKLESPAIQASTTSYLAIGPMPRMGVRTYLPARHSERGRFFFSFSYGINGYETITLSGSNKQGLYVMNGSAWTAGFRNRRLDVELGVAITVRNAGSSTPNDQYAPVVSVGYEL